MLIYNLFPLLAGPLSQWPAHLARAAAMGFNWVFVNPIQRPGGSGSLYSIADYFAINPLLLDETSEEEPAAQVRAMSAAAGELGLNLMVDLVINHCSVDSELPRSHPEWFRKEHDGRVAHPFCYEDGKKVVWRDLAEFDHNHSRDREGLYRYCLKVVEFLIELGFKGFRCDAAYKLPSELWRRLIRHIKKEHPEVLFFAETLGCPPDQTRRTAQAGFDFIFNSSKWWDFHAPWLMAQYNLTREVAPSVSFPESHDTERLMAELRGNLAGVRQRYLFAAMFSAGVMMPVGFEFGFTKRLHVVYTRPEHWEQTEVDLSEFITAVNRIKAMHSIFQEEAPTTMLPARSNPNVLLMWKGSVRTKAEALIILNKDIHNRQHFHADNLQQFVQAGAPLLDVSPEPETRLDYIAAPFHYELQPGQAIVLVTARDSFGEG